MDLKRQDVVYVVEKYNHEKGMWKFDAVFASSDAAEKYMREQEDKYGVTGITLGYAAHNLGG